MRQSLRAGTPRHGFALIAALWLIVAITTIALEFSLQSRERRESAIDLTERTEAVAAAMAGIETERARFYRMNNQLNQNETVPGVNTDHPFRSLIYDVLTIPDTEVVGQDPFIVRIAPNALLNINVMSEDMWRNFLIGFSLPYETADHLAQAIMDWRDPDDLARPEGAERDAYIRAGALALPTNKDFASVGELRDVMGMTPEIYTMISPYLSVCTSGQIDVNAAPAPVLHALPGFTDEVVSMILEQRAATPLGGLGDIESRVSQGARERLAENDSVFARILPSGYTTGLVAVSTGWTRDRQTHVTVEALLDGNANIIWRCDE
jgi:general secretion pathway protein K